MSAGEAWAVVVAAGRGARFGAGTNKVYAPLAGRTVLARSLENIEKSSAFCGVVIVHAPEEEALARAAARGIALPVRYAQGGERRQDSVQNGLRALPQEACIVAVHDGARPLAGPELFRQCVASAREFGTGVAANAVRDTIKRLGEDGFVAETPERSALRAAATPQCFRLDILREAYARADAMGWDVTDDAQVLERCGHPVRLVPCGGDNIKITEAADIRVAEALLGGETSMQRVGMGFDAHRLVEGRRLILCGVDVPFEKGLEGHSDADAPAHALIDALLGAAAMGDIGGMFPDDQERYKGADSMELLREAVRRLSERGFVPCNADVTIIAQRPKLAPYREAMAANLAGAMGIPAEYVSVKMTTTEHMGYTGRGEGIAANAVVLVRAATLL